MKRLVQSAVFLSAAFGLVQVRAAEWHAYAETRDGVSGPQQVVNAITAAAGDGDCIGGERVSCPFALYIKFMWVILRSLYNYV